MSDPLITLLAEAPPNTGPDFGKASPVGLLVVVLLLLGVFGLVWSMNKHLKRVPASFDPAPVGPGDPDGDARPGAADRGREAEGDAAGGVAGNLAGDMAGDMPGKPARDSGG